MTTPLVAIFCMVSLMFLMIGGIIGWLWKDHLVFNTPQQVFAHPEMFDENGNIIPDEVIAVRFENSYDDYEEDDDD